MARLPMPGGDEGTWGKVLNEFLQQTHTNDGSLKPSSVSAANIADGSITQSKLSAGTAITGQVLSTNGVDLVWSSVTVSGAYPDASSSNKGIIQLTGDLSGTAASPTVPGLSTKADASAVYSKSQIDTSLAGKANMNHSHTMSDVTSLQTSLDSKEGSVTPGNNTQYYRGDKTWQTPDSSSVGLGNVDNTSDINKPVSAAVQTALNAKANTASLATVASSGSYTDLTNKPVLPAQLNATAGTNITITGTYPNLTFAATPGAGVTDISVTRDSTSVSVVSSSGADAVIFAADGTNAGVFASADKTKLDGIQAGAQANAVQSVAGKTGVVTLSSADVGLSNVDNTSDATKNSATATLTNKTISGASNTLTSIPQSAVTNLSNDLAAKANIAYTINAQSGTSYTLVASDAGKFLTMNNPSASTLTVPTNAEVPFSIGSRIAFVQMGAGQVTVVAENGVAVYGDPGLKIGAQYGGAELVKLAIDTWILVGRLAA